MSMRAEDIDALIDLLRRDADLRRRVFLALLPEEFLALPARVDHLTELVAQVLERQTRLEERQLALEERQARLEERQLALEERQARLEERQLALEERQARLEERQLALEERQARLEERFAALEERFAALEERFLALEERFAALEERFLALEERFAALDERQARMEERQDRLEESHRLLVEIVNRMDERLSRVEHVQAQLVKRVASLEDKVGHLVGWRLQEQYAKHAYAYFGQLMRRIRVLTPQEIEDRVLDALTPQEQKDLYETDLLLHGRLAVDTSRELVLAMGISSTIKLHDVQRASRRAELMRKAGYLCVPAVGGGAIVSRARREASRLGVVVALDGSIQGWEEALSGLIA